MKHQPYKGPLMKRYHHACSVLHRIGPAQQLELPPNRVVNHTRRGRRPMLHWRSILVLAVCALIGLGLMTFFVSLF